MTLLNAVGDIFHVILIYLFIQILLLCNTNHPITPYFVLFRFKSDFDVEHVVLHVLDWGSFHSGTSGA